MSTKTNEVESSQKMRQSIENGDDPVKVAEAVLQAATAKVPNRKVLVGRGARQARILSDVSYRKPYSNCGLRRGNSDLPKSKADA